MKFSKPIYCQGRAGTVVNTPGCRENSKRVLMVRTDPVPHSNKYIWECPKCHVKITLEAQWE